MDIKPTNTTTLKMTLHTFMQLFDYSYINRPFFIAVIAKASP